MFHSVGSTTATALLLFLSIHYVTASDDVIFTINIHEEQPDKTKVIEMKTLMDEDTQSRPGLSFRVLDHFLYYGSELEPKSHGKTLDSDERLLDLTEFETGTIVQQKRIDREELCVKQAVCFIDLKVIILPQNSGIRLFYLRVMIDDINDNKPMFAQDVVDIVISETAVVGHVEDFNKAKAKDADLDENARISYKLASNEFFKLEISNPSSSNEQSLGLQLLKPLDYTQDPVHHLELLAHDNGIPNQMSNSIAVRVKVSNENNHSPVFEQEVYNVTIGESWLPGRLLDQVKATDGDEKSVSSSSIRYMLSGTLTNDNNKDNNKNKNNNKNGDDDEFPSTASFATSPLDDVMPIEVREDDGFLILRRKVDFAQDDGMKILITADDGDIVNPRKGTAIIQLQVKDDNNHKPVIHFNCLQPCPNNTVYIEENEEDEFTIAHVQAVDDDEKENGKVDIQVGRLLNENDISTYMNSPALVIGKDGLLKTKRRFDHEQESEMRAVIRACDNGSPQKKCSFYPFRLVILDENDNKPVIDCDAMKSVPEDTPLNTIIATVRATDPDDVGHTSYSRSVSRAIVESRNGFLTYSLEVLPLGSGLQSPVTIEAKTGLVRTVRALNYEEEKLWMFKVTVKDGGYPVPKFDTCTLKIRVEDSNDNPPEFMKPAVNRSTIYASTLLQPQHGASAVFYTFKARDLDEHSLIKFSFSVVQKDSDVYLPAFNDRFILDPISGQLQLNGDHPKEDSNLSMTGLYELLVKATDSRHVTSLVVFVRVVDTSLPANVRLGEEVLPGGLGAGSRGGDDVINGVNDEVMADMDRDIFIGITIAGVILIVIALFVICCCIRRYRKRRSDHDDDVLPPKCDGLHETEHVALRSNSHSPGTRSRSSVGKQDSSSSAGRSDSSNNDMTKPLVYQHHRSGNVDAVYNVPRQQISTSNPTSNYIQTSLEVNGKLGSSDAQMMTSLCGGDPYMSGHHHQERSCSAFPMNYDDRASSMLSSCHPGYDGSGGGDSVSVVASLPDLQRRGGRCSKACMMFGHSDNCWMPPPEENAIPQGNYLQTSTYLPRGGGDVTYPRSHHQPTNNHHQMALDRTMLVSCKIPSSDKQVQEKTRKDSGCESVDTTSSSSNASSYKNSKIVAPPGGGEKLLTPNTSKRMVIGGGCATTGKPRVLPDVVSKNDQQQQIEAAMHEWRSTNMTSPMRRATSPPPPTSSSSTTVSSAGGHHHHHPHHNTIPSSQQQSYLVTPMPPPPQQRRMRTPVPPTSQQINTTNNKTPNVMTTAC